MGFDWLPLKNYKRHYICLDCQKGFKRSSEKDMKNTPTEDFSNLMSNYYRSAETQNIVQYIKRKHQALDVICPNCRAKMLQVHYNFEVPRQRDTKAWKTIKEDLSSKMTVHYEPYIRWHKLALLKESKKSVDWKRLNQNLEILEKARLKTHPHKN